MKKQFWRISVLMLLMIVFLSACGSEPEQVATEPTIVTEPIVETTEPELELDPEWLSEAAIDAAYTCLFPLDGEKNVELAQEILLPLVESGNAKAQYYWGYIYDWEIVDNNGDEEKESLYWHNQAIEQGYAKSCLAAALNTYVESEERIDELIEMAKQAGLFEMTHEELGADGCQMIGSYYIQKGDYKKALDWYTIAADMGSTVAMTEIGLMYNDGAGVEKNIDISLDWLLQAATKGNIYAMNWYGYIFFENNYESEFVNNKYATALDSYRQAAEAGDPIAMHNIGQMYENGLGGLRRNAKTALEWYLKAANLGDAYSMYRVGKQYRYAKDYETAIEWYLRAADLGVADAMDDLGLMYSQSLGVKYSYADAQTWYTKARQTREKADNTNNDKYIDYYSDIKNIRDIAIDLFKKSADAGYGTAMNNIGYYGYEKGYVYLNEADAQYWYKKAIEAGNIKAMANLGFSLYRVGQYDAAMKWLIKAHVNGIDYVADDINYMLRNKQGVNAYFENYGELISVKP